MHVMHVGMYVFRVQALYSFICTQEDGLNPPTPLLDRTCSYCKTECGRKAVEDPYHVCMQCLLYERARTDLYTRLQSLDFDFSSTRSLTGMCTALMNVGHPDTVRSVSRYLADCMAIRDVHLGHSATSQWITKANKTYTCKYAASKPTTCDQSFTLLKRHGCDVTACKPTAVHG